MLVYLILLPSFAFSDLLTFFWGGGGGHPASFDIHVVLLTLIKDHFFHFFKEREKQIQEFLGQPPQIIPRYQF